MKSHWLRILLLALFLRLAGACVVQGYLDHIAHRSFLIPGDADGYWELAGKLARGEDFSIYDPPRQVMRMPGLPLLLAAGIRCWGESLFAARLMLAVVGAIGCVGTYFLGRQLLDERVGRVAGYLAAISPTLIVFSVEVLSEIPFASAMVGSLWLMARLLEAPAPDKPHPRWRLAVATGSLIALATYFRPTWILAAPAFGALFLRQEFRQCRAAKSRAGRGSIELACVAMSFALWLAPWTVRNWQITGHAIPTTLWVGPSLYDGLHPQATGDSDMRFFDAEQLLRQMTEYEMDREYRRRALQFVREQPGRACELAVIKLSRFWSPWPNAEQFRHWWMCLGIGLFTVPMFAFAVWGLWLQRGNVIVLILTVAPILYFAGVHAVFVGSIRYRLPAELPLLVLTACGVMKVRRSTPE